jgi:RNA polymerase sigma-54 factor
MKPSLQVRLSQHLALTPQLQQSIRLLQLSTLELHQEVEQMLSQNPLLETEEDYSPSAHEFDEAPPSARTGRTAPSVTTSTASANCRPPPPRAAAVVRATTTAPTRTAPA